MLAAHAQPRMDNYYYTDQTEYSNTPKGEMLDQVTDYYACFTVAECMECRTVLLNSACTHKHNYSLLV